MKNDKLFDTLVLFFSEKKIMIMKNFVIENLKKKKADKKSRSILFVGMYLLSDEPSFDAGPDIIKYLITAAESGNTEAKTALAWIYSTGL